MLPERTTTTGDSLPVTHINAFHIISADVTIMPEVELDYFSKEELCRSETKIFKFTWHNQQNISGDFITQEENEATEHTYKHYCTCNKEAHSGVNT